MQVEWVAISILSSSIVLYLGTHLVSRSTCLMANHHRHHLNRFLPQKTPSSASHRQRDIHSPYNSRQRTHEIPPLNGLDQRKVDERHGRPELGGGEHERPELGLGLFPDDGKIHDPEVDGVGAGPVLCGGGEVRDARGVEHGVAEGARKGAEEERVEGGADGLVEGEFDDCVCEGEFWGGLVLVLLFGRFGWWGAGMCGEC